MAKSSGFKLIANNKKAYFDFFIDDKFECGIALAGTEKRIGLWQRAAALS